MKSLTFVIIWTILFVLFGVYVNKEIYSFTKDYKNKIGIVGKYIENDEWKNAEESLEDFYNIWHEEKGVWYKLLDHQYFDSICLYVNVLDKSILVKDKSQSLSEVEAIKMTLNNMLESSKLDLNHIF